MREWDLEIRSILSGDGFWFAPLSPDTGEIDPTILEVGEHRHNLARKNLAAWLKRVNLPYHSPHKFRHGHIQYGLSHSETLADFKAVSMNVMHSSMEITDEIYSRLDDKEIRMRIEALGQEKSNSPQKDIDYTFLLFKEFLEWIRTKG